MELSTSVAGPEAPVRPGQPVAAAAPVAIDREPKGEGRAIAAMVLCILGVLTTPLKVGPLLLLLGLMLGADSWEDIERDPLARGRGFAVAAFWIFGVVVVAAVLFVLISAIAG
jgi:hypothetical protein